MTQGHASRAACLSRIARLALTAWALVGATPVTTAAEPSTPATPRVTLNAEFVQNPRCPIYGAGDEVALQVTVDGLRYIDDTLEWTVTDYLDRIVDRGSRPVSKGDQSWETQLPVTTAVAGYFQVNLRLVRSQISLPGAGSRPPGFVAYGVLPPFSAPALDHVDQSRFGAQGTCFIQSARQLVGDPVAPVYPLLGAKWIYTNRRPAELFAKDLGSFKPVTDPEAWRKRGMFEAAAGLCLLVDAHSVPAWLMDYPDGATRKSKPNPSFDLQAYPPSDFEVYGKIIGQIAAEQVARRQALFPDQARNYYEIHWEPDWHWKGTDEHFIRMYEVAQAAIHQHDPTGLLLGPNYGVLKTGNEHLARLFERGLGQYLDGIATHTYYIPLEQTPEAGGLIGEMRALVSLARTHLPAGAPIINTEWGLNHFSRPPATDPTALRREAAWFLRGHLITLGEGADTTFFFYTADMSVLKGGGLLYNLTVPHPRYGATHVAPKPVFMACAVATRLLEGSRSLGAIEYLGQPVLGYAFDRGSERIVALWSKDDQDRVVTIPCGTDRVTVVDPMGNLRELPCPGGMARVPISAMPIWIRGVAPAVLPFPSDAQLEHAPRLLAALLPGEALTPQPTQPTAPHLQLLTDTGWQKLDGVIPRSQSAGKVLVGAFASADAVHPQAVTTLDVRPVVSLARAVTATAPGTIAVTVSNLAGRPLRGTLAVHPDQSGSAGQPVDVPAGASVVVVFEPGSVAADISRPRPVTTVFSDSDGSAVQSVLPAERLILSAQRATEPPQMDGEVQEWALESFEVHRDPTGQEPEAACRLALVYDRERLYFAVRVPDGSHVQHQSPADAWKGDSIQVGIALDGQYARGEWHKLCFALDDRTGNANGYCHEGPADLKGPLGAGDIEFAVQRHDIETIYEVAVPWQRLGLDGPPAQIQFGLLINLVDIERGHPTPRRLVDLLGGMRWSNPAEFTVLQLGPREQP